MPPETIVRMATIFLEFGQKSTLFVNYNNRYRAEMGKALANFFLYRQVRDSNYLVATKLRIIIQYVKLYLHTKFCANRIKIKYDPPKCLTLLSCELMPPKTIWHSIAILPRGWPKINFIVNNSNHYRVEMTKALAEFKKC